MGTLLIIDDSPVQRALIRRVLSEGGRFTQVIEACDGIEGLKLLMSQPVDMVLCDLEMPRLRGDKVLALASSPEFSRVPFLMLSAVLDSKQRVALLRRGARDVIAKPVDEHELAARIDLHLELARLQRELAERNALLEQLSCTDALTLLCNRRALDDAVGLEWQRSRRLGTPFSIVIGDVDHFKRINDGHGHPFGDAVLQQIGACFTRRIRATDTAGRLGGEEFMAILAAPVEGALTFAEHLRSDIAALSIPVLAGGCVSPTMSFGVAARGSEHVLSEQVIAAADAALYCAKRAGRNRVEAAPAATRIRRRAARGR
jgi:two-component system, cell cycle response regulator